MIKLEKKLSECVVERERGGVCPYTAIYTYLECKHLNYDNVVCTYDTKVNIIIGEKE